jgi:hypothetical protein
MMHLALHKQGSGDLMIMTNYILLCLKDTNILYNHSRWLKYKLINYSNGLAKGKISVKPMFTSSIFKCNLSNYKVKSW